jgi:CRISPR-associated protein Cas2
VGELHVHAQTSKYQAVWLVALFDLPMTQADDKLFYIQFRSLLLKSGFTMLQFSVYARYCPSEESATIYRRRIKAGLPPQGQVRVMTLTDAQFGRMEIFQAQKRRKRERAPDQLMLF